MKKHVCKYKVKAILLLFILMSALFIITCYKVYSHELKQETKIKNLMLELELLNADTDVERNEFAKNVSLGG